MVNASLNWASIVGIVLAVCGGGLYFLRSFKPALARDYDVFFAAIGLLCGGILFFQGWRLDPILQFGQFLLAGTTVFFAYESVRLRGIATDQARRSSFFEDDQIPSNPRNSSRERWDDDYDQFDQPERPARRFKSRNFDDDDSFESDRYTSRRPSRTIPETAMSRRRSASISNDSFDAEINNKRRRSNASQDIEDKRNTFGERRNIRSQVKRGSRPLANQNTSRKDEKDGTPKISSVRGQRSRGRNDIRAQASSDKVEDASFVSKNNDRKRSRIDNISSKDYKSSTKNKDGRYNVASKKDRPRDNSSRFDD